MEVLQNFFESTQLPVLSAFILGLMTAISPCPMATNITAVGFIGKDLENKQRVFINGLFYTLGRAISYTTIGLVFYFGASEFKISGFLQTWGERFIGPILIIIGLFMLDIIKIKLPWSGYLTSGMEKNAGRGIVGIILMGIVFALAFCPYSGVLFFGMLIPLTVSSAKGLYLPVVYALATGIPVILFSWLIAYSVGSIGKLYKRLKIFEFWFRKLIAIIFIVVGATYIIIYLK